MQNTLFLMLTAFSLLVFLQKRSASHAHPGGIKVYWLKIECKVTSRFAHNVITSRAVNRANVSKEAVFDVDLPKTAFITNFTMTIDGVSYPGVIKEKEAAQQQYQKAVSRGQSADLVKASGRKTEKFTVKVNIAAASKVNFELTYEELLKRTFGKYELYLKINSKEVVNKFEIEANIYEPQGISYLDVEGTFLNNDLLPLVKKSFSGKRGHVLFSPTIDQQRSCENCTTSLLQGDFIIKYDVNRDSPVNLQAENEMTFSDEADIDYDDDEPDPSRDAQVYIFDEYVERLLAHLSVTEDLEERTTSIQLSSTAFLSLLLQC